MRNKKGIEETTMLIRVIAILVFLAVTTGIAIKLFAKADDAVLEKSCTLSNSYKLGVKAGGYEIQRITPNACKTIEKVVPEKDSYSQDEEGAKKQIADLAAECWKMWLKGEYKVFGDQVISGKDRCFICYTFSVDPGQNIVISSTELDVYLESTTQGVQLIGDQCAGLFGGTCRPQDEELDDNIIKTQSRGSCSQDEVCTYIKGNECESQGAICAKEGNAPAGSVLRPEWSCKERGDKCFVDRKNILSYYGFIQNNGVGVLTIDNNGIEAFNKQGQYAITYIDRTDNLWNKLGIRLGEDKDRKPGILISRVGKVEELCNIDE